MEPEAARSDQPRSYRDLISDCVHCGFCLPACPTYASWGNEMDSPRGRIDLMKGVHDGVIELDATVIAHFEACLGCMACVTACPSGVEYDILIESTRATVEEVAERSLLDRAYRALIFALMPYPARLRVLALPLVAYAKSGLQSLVRRSGLLRRLPPRLAQLDALLPPLTFADLRHDAAPFTAAKDGRARARVGLVAGCVQRAFFPNVNAATVRVLSAEGCDVSVPARQGCCGALSLHSGRLDEAKRFARALIERFEGAPVDTIVVNAAGCGSTLKEYGELLDDEPAYAARAHAFSAKVRDVNEFLVTLEPQAPRGRIERRVAYHDACHLAHAQRIREAPRTLLRSIPGLELLEIPQGEMCCGSAGTYNLFQPESAREIGERKADNVTSVAPDVLASANPGCTLQITSIARERGATLPAAHPIELLDLAIRAAGDDGTRPEPVPYRH
jgi:glycolate oxidase iron-sulfur subunit